MINFCKNSSYVICVLNETKCTIKYSNCYDNVHCDRNWEPKAKTCLKIWFWFIMWSYYAECSKILLRENR